MVTTYDTTICDTIEELAAAVEEISTAATVQVVPLPYWEAHRRKNNYKYMIVSKV
jgi:hypothetical protein